MTETGQRSSKKIIKILTQNLEPQGVAKRFRGPVSLASPWLRVL